MIRITALVLVFFVFQCNVQSQPYRSDMDLISSKHFYNDSDFYYYQGNSNNRKIFKTKKKNFIASYNPFTLGLKASMLFYQNVLSPQFSKTCPYEITCSNFCKESIRHFGLVKGLVVGADRIMRCNRIGMMDINLMDIDPNTGKIIESPNTVVE